MARLDKLLGAILRDMVAAQHEAYLYALKLSAAYRDTPATLPTVCFGETELTLHCGFSDDTAMKKAFEIDTGAIRRSLRNASAEIAGIVIADVIAVVTGQTDALKNDRSPIAKLDREKKLKHNFTIFLGDKIADLLTERRAEFIESDGRFNLKSLQEIILQITDEQVLSHRDLTYLFSEDPTDKLRKDIRQTLQADLATVLPHLLKDTTSGRSKAYESIDVVTGAAALAELPPTCIQTLRLKIQPRDLPVDTDPIR